MLQAEAIKAKINKKSVLMVLMQMILKMEHAYHECNPGKVSPAR